MIPRKATEAPLPAPRTPEQQGLAPSPYLIRCQCGERHFPEFWQIPGQLEPRQIDALLAGLDKDRIKFRKADDGFASSYLEGWDVRRRLTQIFGFGGWSEEILNCQQVYKGEKQSYYYVVYMAKVRLTVHDIHGRPICSTDGVGAGDERWKNGMDGAVFFHNAATTACTTALKRAALLWGDQFGLSLYDEGSAQPVIRASLAYFEGELPSTSDVEGTLAQTTGDAADVDTMTTGEFVAPGEHDADDSAYDAHEEEHPMGDCPGDSFDEPRGLIDA